MPSPAKPSIDDDAAGLAPPEFKIEKYRLPIPSVLPPESVTDQAIVWTPSAYPVVLSVYTPTAPLELAYPGKSVAISPR